MVFIIRCNLTFNKDILFSYKLSQGGSVTVGSGGTPGEQRSTGPHSLSDLASRREVGFRASELRHGATDGKVCQPRICPTIFMYIADQRDHRNGFGANSPHAFLGQARIDAKPESPGFAGDLSGTEQQP